MVALLAGAGGLGMQEFPVERLMTQLVVAAPSLVITTRSIHQRHQGIKDIPIVELSAHCRCFIHSSIRTCDAVIDDAWLLAPHGRMQVYVEDLLSGSSDTLTLTLT